MGLVEMLLLDMTDDMLEQIVGELDTPGVLAVQRVCRNLEVIARREPLRFEVGRSYCLPHSQGLFPTYRSTVRIDGRYIGHGNGRHDASFVQYAGSTEPPMRNARTGAFYCFFLRSNIVSIESGARGRPVECVTFSFFPVTMFSRRSIKVRRDRCREAGVEDPVVASINHVVTGRAMWLV